MPSLVACKEGNDQKKSYTQCTVIWMLQRQPHTGCCIDACHSAWLSCSRSVFGKIAVSILIHDEAQETVIYSIIMIKIMIDSIVMCNLHDDDYDRNDDDIEDMQSVWNDPTRHLILYFMAVSTSVSSISKV